VARPLAGIRVLDFTRVLAGPHATRTLCDLGADVIKVEPPDGDLTRFATPKINGLATYFIQQNAGKRNISIDLTTASGAELARDLADQCDVVIENYRAGVMAKLGLDHATLTDRNPRLIYASVTGYGATGPWRHRRAYAPVVNAESGFTKMQSDARGGAYATDPFSHADVYTALEVTIAILGALHERERTGRGRWIDVSMAQTMLYVNEHLQDQLYDGDVQPGWIRSFGTSEYLVFEVASGEHMAVSGHPAERVVFEQFAAAVGRTDLVDDQRFATVAGRLEHLDEISDALLAAARNIADGAEFEDRFTAQGLASGKVRTARELAESPWAAEREAIASVSDRSGGDVRIPNPPWRFDDEIEPITGAPKFRGEDNRAVLREVLGYDDATIAKLEDDDVLSSRLPR